jgi:integrase/recombinase XerC
MEKIDLIQIKEYFLKSILDQKNYSKKTFENYNRDLNKFFKFLNDYKIKDIKKMTKETVRLYFLKQKNNNISNRTLGRYYSSLNSFFIYSIEHEYIDVNPLKFIDYPKYTKKIPEYIYDSQLEKLLNEKTSENVEIELRNKLIIHLLLDTGVRVSELVNIKVHDIDVEERIIKVFGKGSKERFVFFTSKTKELLINYLIKRKEKAITDNLLINYKGEKLTERSVQKIIKLVGEKIGLDIHPHLLRHTFATDLLNKGADIRMIQELLGHENLDTTQIYTHVSNSRVKEVYDNSHSNKN